MSGIDKALEANQTYGEKNDRKLNRIQLLRSHS
jgi:hypothetical protein